MSPDAGYSTARLREHELMDALSDIMLGRPLDARWQEPGEHRQLGYAADLVRSSVDLGGEALAEFARSARKAVAELPPEDDFRPVDSVQAGWGARWHLDARKLRLETPLYVMTKQRRMLRSSISFGGPQPST